MLWMFPLYRPSTKMLLTSPAGLYWNIRFAMFVGVFTKGTIVRTTVCTPGGALFTQLTIAMSSWNTRSSALAVASRWISSAVIGRSPLLSLSSPFAALTRMPMRSMTAFSSA